MQEITRQCLVNFILNIMHIQDNYKQIEQFVDYHTSHSSERYLQLVDLLIMLHNQNQHGQLFKFALFGILENLLSNLERLKGSYEYRNGKNKQISQFVMNLIMTYYQDRDFVLILRSMLTLIVDNQTWLATEYLGQLINNLQTNNNRIIIPTMHIILAILSGYQLANKRSVNIFNQFSSSVFSTLKKIISNNHSLQISYLSIKCLSKVFRNDVDFQIKDISYQWMPVLSNTIQYHQPSFDHNKSDVKQTKEFYYFHSLKWSIKIILYFYQNHASCKRLSKYFQPSSFAERWFEKYGSKFIGLLFQLFKVSLPIRVRVLQLKCFEVLTNNRPEALQSLMITQKLLYKVLPQLIRGSEHTREQSDDFEQDVFTVATRTWLTVLKIRIIRTNDEYTFGKDISECLNYILHLIESNSVQDKHIAFLLLAILVKDIRKENEMVRFNSTILERYFMASFTIDSNVLKNSILVWLIALQKHIQISIDYIEPIINQLFNTMLAQNTTNIQLKCFYVLCNFYKNKNVLKMFEPKIQLLLSTFLTLLRKCPQDLLTSNVKILFQNQSKNISKYACIISCNLINFMLEIESKKRQQKINWQYEGIMRVILQILSKTASLMQNYNDFIILSESLTLLLENFELHQMFSPAEILIIFKNYIKKSYELYQTNPIQYRNIWDNITSYLFDLHQRIKKNSNIQQGGLLTEDSMINMKIYYLRVGLAIVKVIKYQLPQSLLHHLLEFYSSFSKQQMGSKLMNFFCKLYGLVLLFKSKTLSKMQKTWQIAEQVLKNLKNHLTVLTPKDISQRILIICNLLRLDNKPSNLLLQFQLIFSALIEALIKITNMLMRNKMKDEDEGEDEDNNISIYSSARIMDALIDYKQTIETLQASDNVFYQRIQRKVLQTTFERLNEDIITLIKQKN